MRSPKILMVASLDDIHTLRPLNWLLNRGFEVIFLSHFNPFPEGRQGYNFKRFPRPLGRGLFPKIFGKKIGAMFFRFSELTTVLRLKKLWKQNCPDIVHVHWIDDRAHYCVTARLHPLILSVWGSDINNQFLPDSDHAFRSRVGDTLSGADLILIDSADMHKKCAELAGRDVPTKLYSFGLNTERFRPGYDEAAMLWRCKLNIPAEAAVLLSIRGWSPLYRHESILEAFTLALPHLRSGAFLVFKILKRSSMDRKLYEKNMRQLAEKLGVSQRVRWMEAVPQDQLPEIYSFADVVLNYPSMDAFPVTFLEAAACECPVISCRLDAYTGTFAEKYFRMVSSCDLSDLSDAIVDFVNGDRAVYSRRLPELRKIICREHDEKICSARFIEIYRKLSTQS